MRDAECSAATERDTDALPQDLPGQPLERRTGRRARVREQVLAGGSASEIKRAAISNGMQTLRQSGLSKARDGVTTLEEIMRVTMAD